MRKEWSSFLQFFITSIEECMILSFDTIGPFMHFQYLNVCSVIVTSYPGALLEKSLRFREPNIIKSVAWTRVKHWIVDVEWNRDIF